MTPLPSARVDNRFLKISRICCEANVSHGLHQTSKEQETNLVKSSSLSPIVDSVKDNIALVGRNLFLGLNIKVKLDQLLGRGFANDGHESLLIIF